MKTLSVPVALIALIALAPRTARADDAKQACVAAADEGQQLRDEGKYRAARARFERCSASDCPKVVSASCTEWLRALDEAMPTIVVAIRDARGQDVTDAAVEMDGAPLLQQLDGRPITVDAGQHTLRVEAKGSAPLEQVVTIRAGEKLRRVEFALPAPALVPGPPSNTRIIAFGAALVLAGAAAGTGIYFGAASRDDADKAAKLRAGLPPSSCVGNLGGACGDLKSAVDAQNRDASLNVGLFVASGVLAAVSVALLIAWPRAKMVAPAVSEHGAGLSFRGAF